MPKKPEFSEPLSIVAGSFDPEDVPWTWSNLAAFTIIVAALVAVVSLFL